MGVAKTFNLETYAWHAGIDYRSNPERYFVGKGEQGVLICEPYKTEIGRLWRFKTIDIASDSSKQIYHLFAGYVQKKDFVGADMARKYLQMGYTRARRYANYKGGKKYDAENNNLLLQRGTGDPEKAAAADVFYEKWKKAENNGWYAARKKAWKRDIG